MVRTVQPSGTSMDTEIGHDFRNRLTVEATITRHRTRVLLTGLLLAVAILLVYRPVKDFGFVDFDDHGYVTNNIHVTNGLTWNNLYWAFTTFQAANWHPLTWISHMADCQFFGVNPGAHHQTNVMLHIVNTAILLFLLYRMTGALWKSAFVAALFALHPLHVESVVMISQRKDVLSTLFGFLSILFYIPYARTKRGGPYVLSLVCFALSIMAKPMMVTLPFLLMLFDFWPLARVPQLLQWPEVNGRKLAGLVVEKIPFFGVSALSAILTVLAQGQGGAVKTLDAFPLVVRVFNAIVAYIWYPIKTLLPRHLVVFYPHPQFSLGAVEVFGSLLILVGVSYLSVRYAKRCPYLLVGWFSYLGMLVPVIGFVQVGHQGMADRYSYVPLIGLFLIAAWGIPELLSRWGHRKAMLWCGSILTLTILSVLSARQVVHWRNSTVLFERTLALTGENARAHGFLGMAHFREGRIEDAIFHYRESIRIDPNHDAVHTNLAQALHATGDVPKARHHIDQALRLNPKNPAANTNLAIIRLADGDPESAMAHLRIAIEEAPESAKSREVLAQALLDTGRAKEAESHLRHALLYTSTPGKARLMLAHSLLAQSRYKEAIDLLALQLREDPEDIDAMGLLGEALVKTNNAATAVSVFEHQLGLRESPEGRNNLGIALANAGRFEDAVRQLSEAVRMAPENNVFRTNLEAIQRTIKQNE